MLSRPIIKVKLTLTDKIVEIVGWIILVAIWVYTFISYSKLPAIIPTHINFAGKIDSYGSKSSIFFLPIIGLVIFF